MNLTGTTWRSAPGSRSDPPPNGFCRSTRGTNAPRKSDNTSTPNRAVPRQPLASATSSALDQTTISAQLRLNYIITPNLSIEGYLEPFASSGAYTRLGELPEPQSTTLRRYGTDGTTIERFAPDSIVITDNGGADSLTLSDPDFNVLSFRSNLVLRWEWRPGSTLFLVWQQNRGSEVTSSHRVTLDDMWDSFGTEGDNFFALKITYWLGIG